MAKTPPTGLQIKVLQWIADGCPDGAMSDPKFKVSADALDRRNLVRVKRRKNPWIAEITDAGLQLLATRGATAIPWPMSALNSAAENTRASKVTKASTTPSARMPAPPAKSATQQMMDRLLVEHVIEFTSGEAKRYNQLVAVARRKNCSLTTWKSSSPRTGASAALSS